MQQFILIENMHVHRSFSNLSPCVAMRRKQILLIAGNSLSPEIPRQHGNIADCNGQFQRYGKNAQDWTTDAAKLPLWK